MINVSGVNLRGFKKKMSGGMKTVTLTKIPVSGCWFATGVVVQQTFDSKYMPVKRLNDVPFLKLSRKSGVL